MYIAACDLEACEVLRFQHDSVEITGHMYISYTDNFHIRVHVGLSQPVCAIFSRYKVWKGFKLECGPMPNVMAALSNIGGALCSTPQSLPDAHY